MALPGGRWQAGDSDLLATVEREVFEEVGVPLGSQGEVLGQLPSLDAGVRGHERGLVVVPFVFHLTAEPSIRTNEEVDEVVWAELAPLAARDQDTSMVVARDGREWQFPAWVVGERPVWGLTYGILRSFFDLLARTIEG
jgi:8-oxo-dGTP pyrophosphatase MutT (NUDIX family)